MRLCYRTPVSYAAALSIQAGFRTAQVGAPAVLATGFVVAFLHTALPTHWAPFVLAARLRHWGLFRVLGVAVMGAICHALATALIGVLLTGLGLELHAVIGTAFALLAAAVMIGVGGWLTYQSMRSGAHHHHPAGRAFSSDRAAMASLMMIMALSPCEAFLPIYLADIGAGWTGFAVLTLVLGAATICGMVLFTTLAVVSADRLKLERFERYEGAAIGVALMALGVVVLVIER